VALTGGVAGAHTGLTYTPDADYCNTPSGPDDTFTYTLNGGSTATVSVTVTCVDDPPVAVDDTATVDEDSAATAIDVRANDTDIDGGTKDVVSATDPANGTVVVAAGGLTYQPDANYCNTPSGAADTFSYTLNGGSSATVSVTVTCAADNPIVDTSAGALAYTENDPATPIDGGVTVTDPDAGATITEATVAITTNFSAGQDVLALSGVHSGITAVFAGNTLTLSGTASPAAYQAALQAVTYANTSEGPSTLPRTVTFTVTDDTALSGSDTRDVTVAAVNDPPTAVNDSGTTDEDTPLNVAAPGVLANDTDLDPGDTKTVVALNGSGTLTGSSAEGGSVTINANGSYTYTPPSAFQALSTGESDTDSFQYTMADGAGAQSTATVNITVDGVSDAPTAVPDSFDAIGNTALFVGTTQPAGQAGRAVTGSVLTNDTDPDTPHASLAVEAVTATTTLGGTITIEADGNFTYHPDDGDTGVTDTFTYRVCDASPCTSSTVANSTGTLNLPIAGQVWYVKNNSAAGGDGTSDGPFDTLVEAETASGAGDTVYVFDGDNTSFNLNTGYLMETDERLIGEHSVLSLDPAGPVPFSLLFAGTPGAHPTLTTTTAEDVVSLSSGGIVVGLNVDPGTGGGGIGGGPGAGGGAAGNVQIVNVNIVDSAPLGTQPGLELNGTTGSTGIFGLVVNNGGSAAATGVRLLNAGTVFFDPATAISITTAGAKGLDAETTTLGGGFDDITVTGSSAGGLRMVTTTGAVALGDGIGTDLSLTTTSGAAPAFQLINVGATTVASAGTDDISATGGPAVDIVNAASSTFSFDTVSSSNSAGDGINLDGLGGSIFEATGGSIGGAAGIAVDINGGSGNVTYPGALNNGAGQTAEVTGRTGGTVTLGGNIADSNDPGGGIVVSGNTGGSTTFSGSSKVLNAGGSDAVLFTNSDNHTLSFTNGGLDVDTSTGKGIEATTSGTLNVTGANNTIDTGSGKALNVSDTDVGGTPLTFVRIASNGANGGIRLNNTGANNALTVGVGSGTCTAASPGGCTGGVIRNTTGADDGGVLPAGTGIVLNNTRGVSLNLMHIHNHTNYGIRGTNVIGFTMANSVVNAVSGGRNGTSALTAHKDGSVRFEELTGTVNVTNTEISHGYFTNLMVDNTSGVLNATFDNVDSGTLDATGGDDAVQFEGIGTSDMNVIYRNSSITTASGDLFQYIGDGTGGGDLDFTGNTLTNNEPSINTGGGGVALVAGAKGAATMDVLNNSMRDSLTNALTIIKSRDNTAGTNNLVANITGNSIGAAPANSGSREGDGMEITTFGDGNATFNVTNNNIRQYNSSGIQFVAGSGIADTGQLNMNVSGNVISNPGNNPSITLLQGIRVDSGVDPGDTFASCVDFGPNSITGSSDAANKDFRLVASQSTTLRQPGYAGGNTDGVAFAAFAAAQIGGGAQGTAVANAPGTFSGTGTSCP
jgi:VCBS repeat-containing protein